MYPNEPPSTQHATPGAWWARTGEPWALTLLLFAAMTTSAATLLGWLAPDHTAASLGVLGWLACLVVVPRVRRLLGNEAWRTRAVLALFVLLVVAALALPMVGQAQNTAPDTSALTFQAEPRISREMFAQQLQQGVSGGGTSPAAPVAEELYNIIVNYGLDPGVALAFFAHESSFCTAGVCSTADTKSWGNTRRAQDQTRVVGDTPGSSGTFVIYRSWQDGVRDWCELILNRYIARGLDTVEAAIPVYAPASDGNDPADYIETVRRRLALWRSQDTGTIGVRTAQYNNLESGLLTEMFLASGLDYNPGWAFHQYMLTEAQAGRPLGSPLDESRQIEVNGQQYVIQTFALDVIYTPLAPNVDDTDWSDVRRLNDLLRAPIPTDGGAAAPAAPAPPAATDLPTAVPTATAIPSPTPFRGVPVQSPR